MARKLPYPISKEDFEKLLEAAKKERDTYWKPRKKEFSNQGKRIQQYIIAMCFGFGSGMRISEIFGLQKKQRYIYKDKDGIQTNKILISDISPLTFDRIENNFVRIIAGKGKKDGVVPLPTKLLIKVNVSKEILKKELPLKVSYRSAQRYITDLGIKVLNKHITFHMLRHGFVTALLNGKVPIHQVQAWARHSRMDTTGLYAHASISQDNAREVQDLF